MIITHRALKSWCGLLSVVYFQGMLDCLRGLSVSQVIVSSVSMKPEEGPNLKLIANSLS
jgi:hypothetical protein